MENITSFVASKCCRVRNNWNSLTNKCFERSAVLATLLMPEVNIRKVMIIVIDKTSNQTFKHDRNGNWENHAVVLFQDLHEGAYFLYNPLEYAPYSEIFSHKRMSKCLDQGILVLEALSLQSHL